MVTLMVEMGPPLHLIWQLCLVTICLASVVSVQPVGEQAAEYSKPVVTRHYSIVYVHTITCRLQTFNCENGEVEIWSDHVICDGFGSRC